MAISFQRGVPKEGLAGVIGMLMMKDAACKFNIR